MSTAIPEDNPELAAARAAGATTLHRADLLGELSRMKRTIAVSGAHGKTTTASMIAHALRGTGQDPPFLIGGELRSAGTNAAWGAGEWAVIEADESDRSFLKLARDVAVITNVELDHHATYSSLGELEEAFAEFARPARLRVVGPEVELGGEVLRVGVDEGDLQARGLELLPGGSRFQVERHERAAARARPPQRPQRARRPGGVPGRPACRSTRPRRRSPTSRAPAAASRSTASPRAARSSTTTTPTTRPRCAPRWRPPARSRRTVA